MERGKLTWWRAVVWSGYSGKLFSSVDGVVQLVFGVAFLENCQNIDCTQRMTGGLIDENERDVDTKWRREEER
jgi:hypothetical protein